MTSSKQFFGSLESLRGIAALMVVFYHIDWTNSLTNHLIFKNGYLMVDLFFVLSGFVICHNYQAKITNAKSAMGFMFLRFGRLYPLHLFFLLIFLGLEIVKYVAQSKYGFVPRQSSAFSENNTFSFIANLLLIHPFFPVASRSFNVPSWSIGVEFYTYLLFAIVILILPGKRKISIVACVLSLLSAFLLIVVFRSPGLTATAGLSFLRSVMGFFWGVLTYQIYDSHHLQISKRSGIFSFCSIGILLAFLSLKQNYRLDFFIVPIFAVLIIGAASASDDKPLAKVLNCPALRWLGAVSYSIYLCHLFVIIMVSRLFEVMQKRMALHPDDSWIGPMLVLLTVGIVLGISQLTRRWIEIPFQAKFKAIARQYQNSRTNLRQDDKEIVERSLS